jgi:hypothetical protein
VAASTARVSARVGGSEEIVEDVATKSDERFALGLLIDHLTTHGEAGSQCKCNANDPPDLIITWKHDERWGVEVARAYQQVPQIGKAEVVSSESIVAFLRAFGNELGEETDDKRHRDYLLSLEGPGPFSSWKRSVSRKRWKKETKVLIMNHIASGESRDLAFPGGVLIPGEAGKGWRVMIAGQVAEIGSATTGMLRRVLEDKTNDLQRWNGTFSQRWLLLLNCYPLAESAAEVEGTLRRLSCENAGPAGFDGIFWSGYPDRTLIPISLSKPL